MDQVQLKSNDGKMFTVESCILAGSAVLQNRLQKVQTPKTENAILVVAEANANLLQLMLDWLRNHKGCQDSDNTPGETNEPGDKENSHILQERGIGDWEQEFFTNNLPSILLVMAVAKRLNISTLLTVGGRFMFNWIRSNSVQKFSEAAGIKIPDKDAATRAPAGKEKNDSSESNEASDTDQSDGSGVNEATTGEEGSDNQVVEATEQSTDVIPDVIPEEVPEVIAEEVPEPEVIPETAPAIAEETVTVANE